MGMIRTLPLEKYSEGYTGPATEKARKADCTTCTSGHITGSV